MIGQLLGGYRVLERVGEGPNGTVWKAEHQDLKTVVAIKVLPADLAGKPSDRERFERGSRAAARLNHPGIATVFGAEFSGATPYIVSEFVDGETVNARTEAGPLPARQAVEVVLQAARALEYAHQQGVFHRDISGGNVMVTAEGRCKIVDFGIAVERDATRKTTQGTVLGTWAYMAPEALRDETVSESRDTYALGVIFYQLLTGRLPFAAETFEGLVYRILNDDARPPSVYRADLPASVDRLVLRVLEKNPKLRLTIQRFIGELEALQASGALEAGQRRAGNGFGARADQALGRLVRQWTTMAPSQTRKLAMMASVSIVSIALVGWVALRLLPQGPAKPKVASLAIIPLFNESREPGFEYIGHGLAEHLASRLGGLEGLLVQPYRRWLFGEAVELCGQLNVEGVLEGSFAVAGGVVETRMDLVRADGTRELIAQNKSNGYKLAAEELAASVARALKSRLTVSEGAQVSAPAANSNEAFDALIAAADAHQRGDRNEALRWYERAVSLDPGLAKAYTGIASIHYDRYYRGTGKAEDLLIASSHFRQALALEPNDAGALRGVVMMHFEYGERDSGLAVAASVTGSAGSAIDMKMISGLAYLLNPMPELSVVLFAEAVELDPGNPEALWWLTIGRVWAHQFDQAVEAGAEFHRRFDEDPDVHQWVAIAHWRLGNKSLAKHHFQRALELFKGDTQLFVSIVAGDFFADCDDRARAKDVWTEALRVALRRQSLAHDNLRLVNIICGLRLRLGDYEGVFEEMENMDAVLGENELPNCDAMWIADGFAVSELRDRSIRFVRKRVGRKNPFWMNRDLPWARRSTIVKEEPEVESMRAAAYAYDDSLRKRYGLPPRPERRTGGT